ncbi:DUF2179 domain-containing protein [Acetobacterium wieringae]|uniref:DUF2179 domain-containing protein n=1 Tax=Acetobacterium wieringae TaxID=52694 RepID=UPI0026EDD6B0|nr:DUF2179 domain-containing protein [Acetobacterium wieringae]
MTRLFLIIFVQLLYVPMLTLRTICMVKNLKVLTGLFGFMEALIYIFGLAIVLSGEQSIMEMVVYAVGFAAGLTLGIYIEQKLAIGFTSIQVNIQEENPTLVEVLRNEGYGVTVYQGQGKFGKRTNLDILTRRKSQKSLLQLIDQYEPTAFIMSFEPKMFRGGYLMEMMNGRIKKALATQPEKELKSVIEKTVEEIRNETETLKNNWFDE